MAERILDIVAEYPQEQHVAAEMEKVAMQESIGNVGQKSRHQHIFGGKLRRVEGDRRDIPQAHGGSLGGVLTAERGEEIDADIDGDQRDRHILMLNVFQAVRSE